MTEMLACLILAWPIATFHLGAVTGIFEGHHANRGVEREIQKRCGPIFLQGTGDACFSAAQVAAEAGPSNVGIQTWRPRDRHSRFWLHKLLSLVRYGCNTPICDLVAQRSAFRCNVAVYLFIEHIERQGSMGQYRLVKVADVKV